MQELKHYKDGRIRVIDTTLGFDVTFTGAAKAAMLAACEYASSLPPSDEEAPKAKRGPARKKAGPAALPSLPASAPALLAARSEPQPKAPAPLALAIIAACTGRERTAAELFETSSITEHIATDQPKTQHSVIASSLTRMVKAGTLVNIGDRYKVP